MVDNALSYRYEIVSYRWEGTSDPGKAKFASILKTDLPAASKFCGLYFNKFDVIHKMGHIFLEMFGADPELSGAEAEYCATLFALKYFQYKGEGKYLEILFKWVDVLLSLHKANIDYDCAGTKLLYDSYRKDIRTYGAFHFCCMKKCASDASSFDAVLERLGGGKALPANKGIILRPNLSGVDLVNECTCAAFEMNDDIPSVTLRYPDSIRLEDLEIKRR